MTEVATIQHSVSKGLLPALLEVGARQQDEVRSMHLVGNAWGALSDLTGQIDSNRRAGGDRPGAPFWTGPEARLHEVQAWRPYVGYLLADVFEIYMLPDTIPLTKQQQQAFANTRNQLGALPVFSVHGFARNYNGWIRAGEYARVCAPEGGLATSRTLNHIAWRAKEGGYLGGMFASVVPREYRGPEFAAFEDFAARMGAAVKLAHSAANLNKLVRTGDADVGHIRVARGLAAAAAARNMAIASNGRPAVARLLRNTLKDEVVDRLGLGAIVR